MHLNNTELVHNFKLTKVKQKSHEDEYCAPAPQKRVS